jgi:hypothetical protein
MAKRLLLQENHEKKVKIPKSNEENEPPKDKIVD